MARAPRPLPADPVETAPLSEPVRALARRGELFRFAKGAVLIQEGSSGDTLYIVLDGRLRVYGSHLANAREITHGTYGPGEYVGEMSLDGGPRSASVMALEPTLCVVVTRRTLEAHLAEHPQFAFELLAKVIRRARAATLSAKGMALNDVYGRLKLLLETSSELLPDGTRRMNEKLTHLELAHRLGCAREMITRQLNDLQQGGYVQAPRGGELLILKPLPPRW
ncbi:Crp/Fnr family transcriptional regulator [Pseudorhodoferax sp.]|uniref:Crp/Fnr family transcriptional regulator n=1 Tax=Pseudorhodoferax sp. TaxID=1993553 RepID=UPI002DD63010|nr:Crp/Fnr family transcriptional regulator [Pseudorhodoferax sp.]